MKLPHGIASNGFCLDSYKLREAVPGFGNAEVTVTSGMTFNLIKLSAGLATWANALYATNTILNADLHAQMIKGILTKKEHVIYGLGAEMNPQDIGYGHNGARPAYITIMRYKPETRASYVLVANFLDATSLAALNGQGEGPADIVREAIQAVKASQIPRSPSETFARPTMINRRSLSL